MNFLKFIFLFTSLAATANADWQSIPASDFSVSPAPALGSAVATSDMQTVVGYQTTRTADECTTAAEENAGTFPALWGAPAGPLTANQISALNALFAQVSTWTDGIVTTFKNQYQRPRPIAVNSSLQTCPGMKNPSTYSYPSFHATFGSLVACTLDQVYPNTPALDQQGHDIGLMRVISAVHFPSDVQMGWDLGQQMCQQLIADSGFMSQLKSAVASAN